MRLTLPDVGGVRTLSRQWFARLSRWMWLAAALGLVGVVATLILLRGSLARGDTDGQLVATSAPSGAQLEIDGHLVGRSPLRIGIGSGDHQIAVRDPLYGDVSSPVHITRGQTATVRFDLWLRTPVVQPIHASFPGAAIDGADFLPDGQVALEETVPLGNEHQLWLLDPNGTMRQVGPRHSDGPLALAPVGKRVAFLGRSHSSLSVEAGLDEVWVSPVDSRGAERLYTLTAGEGQIVDLSWAPDSTHLLVLARQGVAGGASRTRFLWIALSDDTVDELASIPSEVVPDSYAWSPDGRRVAFLTSTDALTSLCVLDTFDGAAFTYLADLARGETQPFPFPPLAWSADSQRLVFAGPTSDGSGPSGWLFGGKPPTALYQASVVRPIGVRLGNVEGQAPAWRSDGEVIALVPDRGGALDIRTIAPNGSPDDIGAIPIGIRSAFAAR